MTRPRSRLVSVEDTPYYHCICRCVRRAFLCGDDRYSGKSYEHRRQWVRERLRLLTEACAIDVCAYALMSNHYHVVVRLDPKRSVTWSAEEVVSRWTVLFTGPRLIERWRTGKALTSAEQEKVGVLIETWRARLSDLSWFMRWMNEGIARQANREDGCTGRFWEGRFKSQALLDLGGLLTAMAYVDLNPVRAGLAEDLIRSDFTSVQARLVEVARDRTDTAKAPTTLRLLPMRGTEHAESADVLPFALTDYLALVEATGRLVRDDKRGHLPETTVSILTVLGIAPAEWLTTVTQVHARFELVIGAPAQLRALAQRHGRHWYRGLAAAKRLYRAANA